MTAMDAALNWHAEADLIGVHARAFFFDAAVVDAGADRAARDLPVFRRARPTPFGADTRASFVVGDLVAQPDAVFEHGDGLICLLRRSGEHDAHDPDRWPRQLGADAMLQAIAAAMAVAGQTQRPTAALLRCRNVLYQFDPGPPVLEFLATHIAEARRHCGEPRQVTAAQLARFCEPLLRAQALRSTSDAAGAKVDQWVSAAEGAVGRIADDASVAGAAPR